MMRKFPNLTIEATQPSTAVKPPFPDLTIEATVQLTTAAKPPPQLHFKIKGEFADGAAFFI